MAKCSLSDLDGISSLCSIKVRHTVTISSNDQAIDKTTALKILDRYFSELDKHYVKKLLASQSHVHQAMWQELEFLFQWQSKEKKPCYLVSWDCISIP